MTGSDKDPNLDGLLPWYRNSRRDLPWRANRDPYPVWVSEIMLQQTSVAAVIPFFKRWMERFPTVHDLARADEQEALAIWQGLGYYRRCRNLLLGAREVARTGWPTGAAGWRRVPGVGRYTAGAIASIALREATPAVDGNVRRVYARLQADRSDLPDLERRAWVWAERELREAHAGDWNQALMELGATTCVPVNPTCEACPVAAGCLARRQNLIDSVPTPKPKQAWIRIERDVMVAYHEGKFGVRQIPSGQWWEGLWEFPTTSPGGEPGIPLPEVRHTVTNHRITVRPILSLHHNLDSDLVWLAEADLLDRPMPSAQRRVLGHAITHLKSIRTEVLGTALPKCGRVAKARKPT